MIPARAEANVQQTAQDALHIIATARSGSQRIKIDSNGNIVPVDKPKDVIGKLVYAAKCFFNGDKELSSAMLVVVKKMGSDIERAPWHIQKIFSENIEKFQRLAHCRDLKTLATDWSHLCRQISFKNADSVREPLEPGSVPSVTAESFESIAKPSSNPRQSGNAQSREVMQRKLVDLHGLDEKEAASFTQHISEVLHNLRMTFRDFSVFRQALLDYPEFPRNLPPKTEISAAIAFIQEQAKGKSADEAIALVNARIKSLPLIQQYVPRAVTIDCIHEGIVFSDPGVLNAKLLEMLRGSLETMQNYPNTKDLNRLERNPLLEKLEGQFGVDYIRHPSVLKRDGNIDPAIASVTDALKSAQNNFSTTDKSADQKIIALENQWLQQFMAFFGDENVAKVASHYLNQTIFGSLCDVCVWAGHSLVDVIDLDPQRQKNDLRVRGTYTADLVMKEGRQKCVVRADVSKFGSVLLCQNFEEGGTFVAPEKLSKSGQIQDFFPLVPPEDFNTSTPALRQLVEVEFDVNEMQQLKFKPKILNAQIISNIELDWQTLDQIIEANGEYERNNA